MWAVAVRQPILLQWLNRLKRDSIRPREVSKVVLTGRNPLIFDFDLLGNLREKRGRVVPYPHATRCVAEVQTSQVVDPPT